VLLTPSPLPPVEFSSNSCGLASPIDPSAGLNSFHEVIVKHKVVRS
jgi:hypothetical protein